MSNVPSQSTGIQECSFIYYTLYSKDCF